MNGQKFTLNAKFIIEISVMHLKLCLKHGAEGRAQKGRKTEFIIDFVLTF